MRAEAPGLESLISDTFLPERTALLIVDVQNDFCAAGGFFDNVGHPLDSVHSAVGRLESLIPIARAAGVRPIFIRTIYDAQYVSPATIARNRRMNYPDDVLLSGTWGADFFRLRPEPGDEIITKHRYSAFVDTRLSALLRGSGITSLIIGGVATNVCVESTARDAYMLDYHVMVLSDCSGTYDQTLHDGTMENIRRSFGVVATSEDLTRAWQSALSLSAG